MDLQQAIQTSSRRRYRPRILSVISQMGRLGVERGRRNEECVIRAFANPLIVKPDWFAGMSHGDKRQDHKQIDIVVATSDMGNLYLQVKSSHNGAAKFRSRHRDKTNIAVVTVTFHEPDEKIVQIVVRELEDLRRRLLALRG